MTRRQVLREIAECERRGEFDRHVDPINFDNVIRVDKDYHYFRTGLGERLKYFFENIFIVVPFTCKINHFDYHTKVVGKENLRGTGGAVMTCNHTNMFDCLVVKSAVGQSLYITAAPFNNQRGFLGEMMRAGGMMPMSEDKSGMIRFTQAVGRRLRAGKKVLFYPEQAMWWFYQKPRPLKDGAFHFAVKNHVPVIPTFITYTENGRKNDEGLPLYDFTLHITPPLTAPEELPDKEKIVWLRERNAAVWKEIYERFYGKALHFDTVSAENP